MAVQFTESMIIKAQPEIVFAWWSHLEMLPSIIEDIKDVTLINDTRSQWVVKGPLGINYQWTAEITRFDQDRRIAWKTIDGDLKTSGQITFKDLPQDETEMTVTMQYAPPAGKAGEIASKMLQNPQEKIIQGMREFKKFAEQNPAKDWKNK
jgi:uncharacterized membrane protein